MSLPSWDILRQIKSTLSPDSARHRNFCSRFNFASEKNFSLPNGDKKKTKNPEVEHLSGWTATWYIFKCIIWNGFLPRARLRRRKTTEEKRKWGDSERRNLWIFISRLYRATTRQTETEEHQVVCRFRLSDKSTEISSRNFLLCCCCYVVHGRWVSHYTSSRRSSEIVNFSHDRRGERDSLID